MRAPASHVFPERIAMSADISRLYADHLATQRARTDAALERGGFDHLVVPSGTSHYQVFDDRDYPYAVNPHFKAWLPLTNIPGSWLIHTPGERPKVVYLQPHDYWHVVPQAPNGDWVEHFDIHIIRNAEDAKQHLPKNASRCAISRSAERLESTSRSAQKTAPVLLPALPRGYKTAVRDRDEARSHPRGVRGPRAAERAFRPAPENSDPSGLLTGRRQEQRPAVQKLIAPTNTRNCTTTIATAAPRISAASSSTPAAATAASRDITRTLPRHRRNSRR